MSLDHLFLLIRREEVAIWIGAGFSLYAGYPSGKQLQEKIYNQLSDEEKDQLNSNASLRSTASAFVTFRNSSRKELNRIIIEEFSKNPTSTHLHDSLSRIPHLKNIITTNYDSLIETSYAGRAVVIRKDIDVPLVKTLKPRIYKPHGDLESLDKLVITEKDYTNFHNIQKHNPFWVSILDIFAKNNLLFFAYGFEDENVSAWLDLIDETIGNNRKERYLVAPDWPSLKIKQLKERHITYIDSTADSFLEKLHQNLKANIAADLDNDLVSQDTCSEYFNFHNLNINILTANGRKKLAAAYKHDGLTSYKVNLQINDKKIAQKILNFNKGFGKSIKISSNHLNKFEHLIEGFKMNMDASTISTMEFIRLPKGNKCSIEIPDIDLIIEDISFEVYRKSKVKTVIEGTVWGFKIDVLLHSEGNGTSINLNLIAPSTFPSINRCILVQKAIMNFTDGKRTLAHIDGSTKNISGQNFKMSLQKLEDELQYLEGIRKIERYFQVNFEGAKLDFSGKSMQTVRDLNELLEKKHIALQIPYGVAIRKKDSIETKVFNDLPDHITSIVLRSGENEVIELLGRKIDLGEAGLEIQDFEPLTYNDEKTIAVLKSKTEMYLKRYSSVFPFDSLNDLDEIM